MNPASPSTPTLQCIWGECPLCHPFWQLHKPVRLNFAGFKILLLWLSWRMPDSNCWQAFTCYEDYYTIHYVYLRLHCQIWSKGLTVHGKTIYFAKYPVYHLNCIISNFLYNALYLFRGAIKALWKMWLIFFLAVPQDRKLQLGWFLFCVCVIIPLHECVFPGWENSPKA